MPSFIEIYNYSYSFIDSAKNYVINSSISFFEWCYLKYYGHLPKPDPKKDLFSDADITRISFTELEYTLTKLTAVQYRRLLLQEVDTEFQQYIPNLNYSLRGLGPIQEYTDTEIIAFHKWMLSLYNIIEVQIKYTAEEFTQALEISEAKEEEEIVPETKQMIIYHLINNQHAKQRFHRDTGRLSKFIQNPLTEKNIRKLLFQYEQQKSFFVIFESTYIKQLKQFHKNLERDKPLNDEEKNTLFELVKTRHTYFTKTKKKDALYHHQVFLVLTWFLERAGFSSEQMRPVNFDEIGIDLASFGEIDLDNLFISKLGIINVKDILDSLDNDNPILRNPNNNEQLTTDVVTQLLTFSQPLRKLIQTKYTEMITSNGGGRASEETLSFLLRYAGKCYKNSTHYGGGRFSQERANELQHELHQYAETHQVDFDFMRNFKVNINHYGLLTLDDILTKPAFQGCSGVMGENLPIYIRGYMTATKNSKKVVTPYDEYIAIINKIEAKLGKKRQTTVGNSGRHDKFTLMQQINNQYKTQPLINDTQESLYENTGQNGSTSHQM